MTEQQQADYVAGKTVVMSNMVDQKGNPCTVYLTFNPESQRPNSSFTDPVRLKPSPPPTRARRRWP